MAKLQMVSAVEPQLVEMMVPLYSHGCAKKVRKTLSHLKGIYSVNVDYKEQKVTVWGICNKYQVLRTVRSKRKAARFWNFNPADADDDDDGDGQCDIALPLSPSNSSHTSSTHTTKPFTALTKFRALSFKLACKKMVLTARSYSFGSK